MTLLHIDDLNLDSDTYTYCSDVTRRTYCLGCQPFTGVPTAEEVYKGVWKWRPIPIFINIEILELE